MRTTSLHSKKDHWTIIFQWEFVSSTTCFNLSLIWQIRTGVEEPPKFCNKGHHTLNLANSNWHWRTSSFAISLQMKPWSSKRGSFEASSSQKYCRKVSELTDCTWYWIFSRISLSILSRSCAVPPHWLSFTNSWGAGRCYNKKINPLWSDDQLILNVFL